MNLSVFRNYLIFILITSLVSYPISVFLTATGGTVSMENLHFFQALQYWFLLALPLFTILFFLLRYILKMLKQ